MGMDLLGTILPAQSQAPAAVLGVNQAMDWPPPLQSRTRSVGPLRSQTTTNARSFHSSLDKANRTARRPPRPPTATNPLPAAVSPPALYPPHNLPQTSTQTFALFRISLTMLTARPTVMGITTLGMEEMERHSWYRTAKSLQKTQTRRAMALWTTAVQQSLTLMGTTEQ